LLSLIIRDDSQLDGHDSATKSTMRFKILFIYTLCLCVKCDDVKKQRISFVSLALSVKINHEMRFFLKYLYQGYLYLCKEK